MENRDKILDAALLLFTSNGLQKTTTAKITKEADVSNGTFFYYFKTKDDLITSLYKREIESFRSSISENLSELSGDKESVKILWFTSINWFLKNKASFAFFNMYSTSPDLNYLREKEPAAAFTFVGKVFKQLIENDLFEDIPSELILSSFYGSIISIFDYCVLSNDDNSKYKEVSFDIWWRSISKKIS